VVAARGVFAWLLSELAELTRASSSVSTTTSGGVQLFLLVLLARRQPNTLAAVRVTTPALAPSRHDTVVRTVHFEVRRERHHLYKLFHFLSSFGPSKLLGNPTPHLPSASFSVHFALRAPSPVAVPPTFAASAGIEGVQTVVRIADTATRQPV
jgi:hypothetical protein